MPSSLPALQDQGATEGDNMTLLCPVSGMPPPAVSWMTWSASQWLHVGAYKH